MDQENGMKSAESEIRSALYLGFRVLTFNRWWKRADKLEKKEQRKTRKYINSYLRSAYKYGLTSFRVEIREDRINDINYAVNYLKSLGFENVEYKGIWDADNYYQYHVFHVEIPEREDNCGREE